MSLAPSIADQPIPPSLLARASRRHNASVAPGSTELQCVLPVIEPGQLWLVEWQPGRVRATAERHLLSSANVILYDRGLAEEVAAILPLGGYAEPAPSSELPDAALIDRCVRFALDGWSVVRLIDGSLANPNQGARLRAITARLRTGGADAALPVRIFADAGGRAYAVAATRLGDFDAAAASARGERLVVVFGAAASGIAPPPVAVAANGLAG